MAVRVLSSAEDLKRYDAWVRTHPQGSLWQSLERKKYVEACGKQTRIYAAEDNDTIIASALVVIDKTTGGFSTWDIPRGPLTNETLKMNNEKYAQDLLGRILSDAKQERCLALYLSPASLFTSHSSFFTSPRRIHAQATRIIDLTQTDEQILAQMHQKGRYNIGVAARAGVTVREGLAKDIDAFYDLLVGTGGRDGFTIFKKSHYTRFITSLKGSFILLAEHEGRPIAGLIGVTWGKTGIYYYGASSYHDRQFMAPYALQWAAMQHCKAAGCTRYDLLGISPENAPKDDSWQGITDFKRKFGGTVVSYPAEQMLVLKPMTKMLLDLKRKILG